LSKPVFLEVPIEELRPNPWNVNSVSPENEEKLIASVRRLGLYEPIKVRQVEGIAGYEILGGEHRWNVAKHLGHTTIQVANLGFIDEQVAKEIMLADNSRYGTDDVVALAVLLEELGTADDISSFLPYTDSDLNAIFSSIDIDLDELEENEEDAKSDPETSKEEPIRAPKTHALMRYKVPIGDAERITELIAKTQKKHGYSGSDELTNAGDALVHLLLGRSGE
jgi:ParB-like chromosome segregation protein Spo0J